MCSKAGKKGGLREILFLVKFRRIAPRGIINGNQLTTGRNYR
jgi:hypothetical protein